LRQVAFVGASRAKRRRTGASKSDLPAIHQMVYHDTNRMSRARDRREGVCLRLTRAARSWQ
jgi:hypothetical protein